MGHLVKQNEAAITCRNHHSRSFGGTQTKKQDSPVFDSRVGQNVSTSGYPSAFFHRSVELYEYKYEYKYEHYSDCMRAVSLHRVYSTHGRHALRTFVAFFSFF